MMHGPQKQRASKESCARTTNAPPIIEEDPSSPRRHCAEEQDGGQCCGQKALQQVDRDVGPDNRKEQRQEIRRPKSHLSRENECGPEQRECRPSGRHLVPVQPRFVASDEEADDGAEPRDVEETRHSQPTEIRLSVTSRQKVANIAAPSVTATWSTAASSSTPDDGGSCMFVNLFRLSEGAIWTSVRHAGSES